MLVSKCPVRISIAGGSTDLDAFVKVHGRGAVISFAANLYTYITLFRDKFGQNFLDKKYNIVYSSTENVTALNEIKNDVARVVLSRFNCKPLSCWFTADVSSVGSGLASSSSYILSLVHAVNRLENLNLSKLQIIETAWQLEKEFNPLTGFQDPYGCATGGLNLHEKFHGENVCSAPMNPEIFNNFSMFLLPTFIKRSSTNILEKTQNKVSPKLLEAVDDMSIAIQNQNVDLFLDVIKEGWKIKKNSSLEILKNQELQILDNLIDSTDIILAHRLIGAGNGGYFLLITAKDACVLDIENTFSSKVLPVSIDYNGIVESVI